jgi:hypothetical protein
MLIYMVRRGSVGSASACCKAGPSSIIGSASDEETDRGFSEWRRMNVLRLNECMYVIKYETPTKPLTYMLIDSNYHKIELCKLCSKLAKFAT